MRAFFLMLCILAAGISKAQIRVNGNEKTVTVIRQEGKICKHLFIDRKSNRCNKPLLYYTAVYSCNGKTIKERKRPRVNFKDEIPVINKMMDSVRAFMLIDLCALNIRLEEYDDLMSRLIDKFGGSEEWKKSIERRGMKDGKPDFDKALIVKVMRDEGILDPLDEFLNPYGFRVAVSQVLESDITQVSKKELKRLGKDENLVIPLPSPIWIQVSQTPR